MICFGAKTDQEVKEKVTCGSRFLKKIKIKNQKRRKRGEREKQRERDKTIFFIYFSSLTSLFDIRKSDRRNSSGQERKGSTRRGLRMGTKNTGFHQVFN